MKSVVIAGLILAAVSSSAWALPTVDGTKDAEYGAALAVQTVQTNFGDNNSELNAGYAIIGGTKLYLFLSGNIEANFNNIEIFIDSKAGGQNIYDSSGNSNTGTMDGFKFDAGFTADYHVIANRGNDGSDKFNLDFANLVAQSASGYLDFLIGGGTTGIGTTGTGVNASPILVGYNNSNILGVTGGINAADQTAAANVSTGFEIAIELSDLGYLGGPINIMAAVNNGDHNYWSNQFLGGLAAPQANLGGDGAGGFTGEGAIDMTTFAGDQFFTLVPEPASLSIIGIGAIALLARRRRA